MEKTGPQTLNQKQLKFVELYAGGYSATEAYMQAYDLPEERRQYAGTSASRLLKTPKVHDLVVKIQKQVFDSLCLNAEKQLSNWRRWGLLKRTMNTTLRKSN